MRANRSRAMTLPLLTALLISICCGGVAAPKQQTTGFLQFPARDVVDLGYIDKLVVTVNCSWIAEASAHGVAPQSLVFYEAVREKLFALSPLPENADANTGSTVLTFEPGFGPGDMRIVSRRAGRGPIHLEVVYLDRRAPNLWAQVVTLTERRPNISVDEAVAAISVRRDSRVVPPAHPVARLFVKGESLATHLQGASNVSVDRPVYRLEVLSRSKSLDLTITDAGADPDIVRWMNQVREAVERLLASSAEQHPRGR